MEISELVKKNPWWQGGYDMNSDKHIADLKLQPVVWKPEIIPTLEEGVYTIRGPRQVGKTTWIKMKIRELLIREKPENIFFHSCDLMRKKEEIVGLVESYLRWNAEGKYLFLDEISYVEDWQLAIKHLVDAGTLQGKVVVVTGSNAMDMRRNIEQLPGRMGRGKRHFVFFPMCFSRFVKLMNGKLAAGVFQPDLETSLKKCEVNLEGLNRLLIAYLQTGGFPRVINEYAQTGRIEDDTYEIYISWIRGEIGKWRREENASVQIIKKILESYVTELNWNRIRAHTDMESHHTVAGYVEMFEKMFLLQFIYAWDGGHAPLFRKNKKLYFVDPFIHAAMEKWALELEHIFEKQSVSDPERISKIIEGVVLNHLVSHETKKSGSGIFDYKNRIFYLRTQRGREIDFVVSREGQLGYVEVKWREKAKTAAGVLVLTRSELDMENRKVPVSVFLALEEYYDQLVWPHPIPPTK